MKKIYKFYLVLSALVFCLAGCDPSPGDLDGKWVYSGQLTFERFQEQQELIANLNDVQITINVAGNSMVAYWDEEVPKRNLDLHLQKQEGKVFYLIVNPKVPRYFTIEYVGKGVMVMTSEGFKAVFVRSAE